MLLRLRRFLDIRPGEGLPLLVTFLYVGVAVASFLLAKSIRNGLFLQEYGAYKLVYVYVGVPIVLAVTVPLFRAVARHVGSLAMHVGSQVFLAANVLAFWYGSRQSDAPWLAAAFYIWVNCYGVIAPVQAWTFANRVFDTRQARRLFGLVGAGASVGAIVGGLMARELVGRVGGAVNLMLVLAVLILSGAVIVGIGWQARRPAHPHVSRPTARFADTLVEIARTPYLRNLSLLVMFVAIVTQWIQFNFSVAAADRFLGDADSLTRFFGTFNFAMGIVALLLQLLVTGPALRKFGIGVTIVMLPLALFFGSALVVLYPVFWALMLSSAFDQGLRFSIDKATFELLYLPLAPELKANAKSAIDVIINRVADAVGGVLLGVATQGFNFVAFALPGLHLGVRGIAAASAVMCLGWVAVALSLKRGYVQAIRESIESYRLDAEQAAAPTLDRETTDFLAGKLTAKDTNEILYALDLFASQHAQTAHPAVRTLVRHPAATVRRRALQILDQAGDVAMVHDAERLLYDSDLGVRTEALLFLAHHANIDPLDRIEKLGDFADFSVQAGLVAFLSRPGRTENLEAARVVLGRMVDSPGPEGVRSRLEAARLLADIPPQFPEALAKLVGDPDPEVARQAMHAVGRLQAAELVPQLVKMLGEGSLAERAGDALASVGQPAVTPLVAALDDPNTPSAARIAIPAVLAQIGTLECRDALLEHLLEPDSLLRFRVIQGLNRLHQSFPDVVVDRDAIKMGLGAEILGHYRSYQILGTAR